MGVGEEFAKATQDQAIRKSNVRVFVTYFIVCAYALGALGLTAYLVTIEKYELGLGIFNGLSAIAASIAGFWFGNRGNGHPENAQDLWFDRGLVPSDAVNVRPAGSPAGGADASAGPKSVVTAPTDAAGGAP